MRAQRGLRRPQWAFQSSPLRASYRRLLVDGFEGLVYKASSRRPRKPCLEPLEGLFRSTRKVVLEALEGIV